MESKDAMRTSLSEYGIGFGAGLLNKKGSLFNGYSKTMQKNQRVG